MALLKKIESDFISKGADVASDKKTKVHKSVDICLRMPYNMMREIDGLRDEGVSRNAWIREAISKRLKRLEGHSD